MEPKLFVATKAVIVHDGKVLLLREAGTYADGTNVGRYDVCGGRLKPGEHFQEALQREVLEETGLEITVGEPIAVGEWRPIVRNEQWQIVGIYFLCQASSAEVRLSEDHDHYLWIDPATYAQFNILDTLKTVFAQYLKKQTVL